MIIQLLNVEEVILLSSAWLDELCNLILLTFKLFCKPVMHAEHTGWSGYYQSPSANLAG